MKRTVSASVFIGKFWKITRKYLGLVRYSFFDDAWQPCLGKLPGEYNEYSLVIIRKFRDKEKEMENKDTFRGFKFKDEREQYEEELKKLIQGIKNKYNTIEPKNYVNTPKPPKLLKSRKKRTTKSKRNDNVVN